MSDHIPIPDALKPWDEIIEYVSMQPGYSGQSWFIQLKPGYWSNGYCDERQHYVTGTSIEECVEDFETRVESCCCIECKINLESES